jgi:hypothetical protein
LSTLFENLLIEGICIGQESVFSIYSANMSGPDPLFAVKNNFYLGAYQAAINESNVSGLSDAAIVERASFVYRSYVALGSYQVCAISGVVVVYELDVYVARSIDEASM